MVDHLVIGIYSCLQSLGLKGVNFTFSSVLESCMNLLSSQIRKGAHEQSLRIELDPSSGILGKMIKFAFANSLMYYLPSTI